MNFFKSIFGRIFSAGTRAEAEKVQAGPEAKSIEKSIEAEVPLALTIWTIERNRYAPARALCTDIEVYPSEALLLHEEINGYVIDTPSGESVVIEARTGSLVGHSLEVVRDGVREMTKAQLNAQLDSARKEFNRMKKQELSNEEFWLAIKMGGSEIDVAQDYEE
ncbi:MAG: hypothetical protein B7Y56_11820 [Gallionellales bacterium 35-53-114]|jgi:hypothetical protein|nr:MAG: hypothetical protein B7Y56_11820 [Gallionellales bacterium 35-53-114]OYZ64711.1 MAG: hypothetical protein B7Y04_02780 [Gallionellales bacterium 24-53-125]OZB07750.1 MAG: hypothetical protein B7X61_14235 [Gallionellales bacterium 39-52-133]HQS58543.1 hypothetical protein [Gallionellaceae bacterium]HQS74884.1 hypothetical protein [Gallionellaceae bacterium]